MPISIISMKERFKINYLAQETAAAVIKFEKDQLQD